MLKYVWGFPGGISGKESVCQCRKHKRHGFNPWIGKIPWRRKWQPAPVFLPGKSQGQGSLVSFSPWGHKESDITECAHTIVLCIFVNEHVNMLYIYLYLPWDAALPSWATEEGQVFVVIHQTVQLNRKPALHHIIGESLGVGRALKTLSEESQCVGKTPP